MWMLIGAAVAAVAVVMLAVFDVFWPLTAALALVMFATWWVGGLASMWPLMRPEFLAVYLAVGFAWVFFKWTRLVEKKWREPRYSGEARTPPKWSDHSYDFAAYFFYWPVDMIAYVLSDLMRDAWRFVSNMIGRSFDRYAEWRFKSVADQR